MPYCDGAKCEIIPKIPEIKTQTLSFLKKHLLCKNIFAQPQQNYQKNSIFALRIYNNHIVNTHLTPFLVNIRGLKVGKHHLDFEINDPFFECFEYSTIKKGSLKVGVDIDRQTNLAYLRFDIVGSIQLPCDTCLVALDFAVDAQEKLIVKQAETKPPTTDYDDDDIAILPEDQSEIDLSAYIYEYIALQKQQRIACDDIDPKPCDPAYTDVLKKLAPPAQNPKIMEDATSNPAVWDKLKNLKF
jgi:uncharacterized metal-binding protein YceD (DUF177 family)